MANPTYGQMIEAADNPAHMTGMIIRSLKNDIDELTEQLSAQGKLIQVLCEKAGITPEGVGAVRGAGDD